MTIYFDFKKYGGRINIGILFNFFFKYINFLALMKIRQLI